MLAAFVTGVALFVAVVSTGASYSASARGGFTGGNFITLLFPDSSAPKAAESDDIEILPHRHGSKVVHASARRAVCVKLCDGAFFPLSPSADNDEAACASQCPDAPTSVFYRSAGSDGIADAVSATGERYSALPVALRYRTTSDNTCSCHRRYSPVNASFLSDPTLRKGDAVVTEAGVFVFHGAPAPVHARSDFTALALATVPPEKRAELASLERTSRAPQLGAPRSWFASRERAPEPTPIRLASQAPKDEIHFVQVIRGSAN